MNPVNPVQVGPISIGGGHPLAFILGPCVIESPQHALETAAEIKEIAARCAVPVIFKASYDKANRTSGTSFRGPGLESGLATLGEIRARTGSACPDRHSRACPRGGGGRRGRRAADPGVPVATDGPARGGRAHGQGREREEGPVPRAEGHGACDREGDRRRQPVGPRHRARCELRLQQPRGGHASIPRPA